MSGSPLAQMRIKNLPRIDELLDLNLVYDPFSAVSFSVQTPGWHGLLSAIVGVLYISSIVSLSTIVIWLLL